MAGDGLVEAAGLVDAFGQVQRLAADHHHLPPGQRPADRFPGLATQQDRMAHGLLPEVFQVFGQVPGQGVVPADHAIAGAGGDQGDQGQRHR